MSLCQAWNLKKNLFKNHIYADMIFKQDGDLENFALREIHVSNIDWKFSLKSYALKATAVFDYSEEFFHLIQQKSLV